MRRGEVRRGGHRWSPMETHHCQAAPCFFFPSPSPANSGCATTAQPATCKNMLNIYLAQLFSNSDCGNEKGCRGGVKEREGSEGGGGVNRQHRVRREQTKTHTHTKNKFTSVLVFHYLYLTSEWEFAAAARSCAAVAINNLKTASIGVFCFVFLCFFT